MHLLSRVLPLLAAFAALAPSNALAQEATPPAARGAFLADLKVGGVVSFGGLDPDLRPALGLGYLFPWLDRGIAAQLQVDYAAFNAKGSDPDPRVGGGSYTWDLTEQTLAIFPWAMYRFTKLGRVVPFAGVGPRVYLLRSVVKGTTAGGAVPETREQSTELGLGVPLGAEFRLGPGALLGEFLLEYGPLDHKATGSSNTGGVTLFLGYRFQL
jgi:hypothetical protein